MHVSCQKNDALSARRVLPPLLPTPLAGITSVTPQGPFILWPGWPLFRCLTVCWPRYCASALTEGKSERRTSCDGRYRGLTRHTGGRHNSASRPEPEDAQNRWFARLRACMAADEQERGPLLDLTAEQVLSGADAYRVRTGVWPTCRSGSIPESAGETWLAVEAALCLGLRGFTGRSTLARFLARHRHRYNPMAPPPLTARQYPVVGRRLAGPDRPVANRPLGRHPRHRTQLAYH
jgi:hypothetical protein